MGVEEESCRFLSFFLLSFVCVKTTRGLLHLPIASHTLKYSVTMLVQSADSCSFTHTHETMATGNEMTYTSQERLTQLRVAESLYDAGLYKSALLIVSRKTNCVFSVMHMTFCLCPSRVYMLRHFFVCDR